MGVCRLLILGAVLCLPIVSGQNLSTPNKKGRTFIAHGVETGNGTGKYIYTVTPFVSKVLSDPLTTAFLPAVYIIVFIIGFPSNAIALWVFFFRTKKKHPAMIYMANLALADLMFVIWLPLKIAYHLNGNNWIYGEGLCKVLIGFFYGNMYCSILFITCLSVQRYWVIVNPISHTRKNTKSALIVSITVWVVIMVGTIPLYLIDQTLYLSDLGITTCHDVLPLNSATFDLFNYFLALAIGVFFLPAILTVVVYTIIIKTLTASITDESIGKKRKKAIRLIIIILVMYLVCFLPSNLLLVIHYGSLKNNYSASLYTFYITALCLSSLNSSIDPFVYYFISKDFRDHVKNTFLCRSVRTVERMRISFSSMKYSRKTSSYTTKSTDTKTSSC